MIEGQALAVELYREGGIRGCEVGSVMFGKNVDNPERPAAMELLRLAVPRRLYTKSHFDYAVEVIKRVAARAYKIQGMTIVKQPSALRHFSAHFKFQDEFVETDRWAVIVICYTQPKVEKVYCGAILG